MFIASQRTSMEDSEVIITYEAGIDERPHPDITVCARLVEVGMGKCGYGCKIYADPRSAVLILAHNATYGCRRKASDVQVDH